MASVILLAATSSFSQAQSTAKTRPRVNVVVASGELDAAINLIEGNVVMVHDGDNISIAAKDGSTYSVRLQGIDAPETAQPFGKESTQQLAALIQGMDVVVMVRKRGENDRYIGTVFLDGQDVSRLQLKAGMAWNYPPYNFAASADDLKAYEQAEQSARDGKIGLWRGNAPVAPWEYRGEAKPVIQNSASAAPQQKSTEPVGKKTVIKSEANSAAERKYILGPRGGCYYLKDGGIKVYVSNKSLCAKPQ